MNVIVFETFKHMSAPCLSKTTRYIYDMFMWLPLAQCKGYLCNKRRHKKLPIHIQRLMRVYLYLGNYSSCIILVKLVLARSRVNNLLTNRVNPGKPSMNHYYSLRHAANIHGRHHLAHLAYHTMATCALIQVLGSIACTRISVWVTILRCFWNLWWLMQRCHFHWKIGQI